MAKLRFLAFISILILISVYYGVFQKDDADIPKIFSTIESIIIISWLFGYNTINSAFLSRGIYHPSFKYVTAGGDILCATLLTRVTGGIASPFLIGYTITIFLYGIRYRLGFSTYTAALITIGYFVFNYSESSKFFFIDELIKIMLWWLAAILAGLLGSVLSKEHRDLIEVHDSLVDKVDELEDLRQQYDAKRMELDNSLVNLLVQTKQLEIERDRSVGLSNELKRIRQHSQNVNNTFDIDEIYEHTARSMAEIVITDYINLYRFDVDKKYGYVKSEYSNVGGVFQPLDMRFSIANNPVAFLLQKLQSPLSIENIGDERQPRQVRNLMRSYGFRSALLVPILVDKRVHGVIGLDEAEKQRVFTAHESQLCQTIANQTAQAIQRAQLFEKARTSSEKLQHAFSNLSQQTEAIEQRAQELSLINEVTRSLNSTLDFENMIQAVLSHMATLAHVSRGVLFLQEEDSSVVKMVGEFDGSRRKIQEIGKIFVLDEHPMLKKVMEESEIINIPDTSDPELDEKVRIAFEKYGIKSVLMLPLIYRGQTVGVINLDEMTRKRAFSDSEVKFSQMVCNQAAIAIENSLLYTNVEQSIVTLREFNERLSTLYEVSASLTIKQPISEILCQLVNNLGQMFDVQFGQVFLYPQEPHAELQSDESCAYAAFDAEEGSDSYLEEGWVSYVRTYPASQIMEQKDTLMINDMLTSEVGFSTEILDLIQTGRARSMIRVPMIAAGEVVGAVELYFKELGPIPEDHIQLITTAANQTAISVENSRLYHELQKTTEKLELVNQAKSNFVAVVSHDLRTPLTSIKSFSSILLDEIEEGEIDQATHTRFLRIIENETDRMNRLITDLLDLQKIESGKIHWTLEPHDFGEILKSVVATFFGASHEKSIVIKTQIQENLPLVTVDKDRFMQAIANLLSNAIKFTDEHGVITVSLSHAVDHLLVYIEDTGVGIPSDQLEYVFERFRQIKRTTRKKEGTGLGLAITKEIVEYHQGRIWVESEMGKGSTFYLTIPDKPTPVEQE